jgi:hypothetical protein
MAQVIQASTSLSTKRRFGKMKSEPKPDERDRLSSAIYALKQKLGPRVTAHLLYHQALDLTKEADELAERAEVAKE